jgi:tetratricopeptide (TPR) repeat protein
MRTECSSFLVVGAALSLLVSGSSALAQGAALERCRETVGKPIVQACRQAGGDLAACQGKASPRVRACVQAASGGGGGAKGSPGGAGRSAASPMVGKARQLVMNGQFSPAIELLDKAIKQDLHFAPAYQWRGIAKLRMGQFAESLADFDKSLELDSTSASALSGRGYATAVRVKLNREPPQSSRINVTFKFTRYSAILPSLITHF